MSWNGTGVSKRSLADRAGVPSTLHRPEFRRSLVGIRQASFRAKRSARARTAAVPVPSTHPVKTSGALAHFTVPPFLASRRPIPP